MQAELSNLPPGTTLYLGIAAGNSSGPGFRPAFDYQLWIDRESGRPVWSGYDRLTRGIAFAAITPVIGSAVVASTGLARAPTRAMHKRSEFGSEPAGWCARGCRLAGSAFGQAVGGLTLRRRPRPLRPHAISVRQSTRSGMSGRATDPRPEKGTTWSRRRCGGSENEPDALVVIHGPGGFPLVGAVAIGHRHRNPATEVGDFATSQAIGEPGLRIGGRLGSHVSLRAEGDAPASDNDPSRLSSVRDLAEFPVSVFSGLGLATVFTLNAVLSQPIAGFDYLTSRFDAGTPGRLDGSGQGGDAEIRSASPAGCRERSVRPYDSRPCRPRTSSEAKPPGNRSGRAQGSGCSGRDSCQQNGIIRGPIGGLVEIDQGAVSAIEPDQGPGASEISLGVFRVVVQRDGPVADRLLRADRGP